METPKGLWIPKKSNKESSWEELAFAEDDAAGSLWPPRSYTCSFCRREFRSAQALGGHMNVHRRDRAQLKQSGDEIPETSSYTLVFNSNPNRFKTNKQSCLIDLSSSFPSSLPCLNPSSVSSEKPRNQKDTSSSCFVLEPSKNSKKNLPSSPWSCPGTKKRCDLYEIPVMEGEKKRKMDRDVPKIGHKAKLNLGNNTDLSVSMNLVIHQGFHVTSHGGDEEIERGDNIKRRRMCESSSQPSLFISSLSCKSAVITRNDEIKDKGAHFEELDLELRLGADPSKGN